MLGAEVAMVLGNREAATATSDADLR